MPPKGYKKKPIVVESESDSESDIPQKIKIESDSEDEIPPKKNQVNYDNYDNYEFDINTIYKYCDFINESYKNYSMDKTLDTLKKIDKVKETIIDKRNFNNRIINETHQENCLLDDIVDSIQDIISNVNKHEEKLKKEIKVNKTIPNQVKYNSVTELINGINNEHQQSILYRISSDAEYAKVYLQNFTPNTDNKKKTLKGTINILGNYNKSKGIREAYEVKVFENDPKGSFWCSCADHKFNSAKKNIVCKHICFIVCKVLKILDPYFFDTKTLKQAHLLQLLDKFNINSDIWKDKKLARTSNKVTIQDFKIFPEHINDTCTFCYDEMTDADRAIACACPLCKHCFHEECMDVWMEGHDKCSYCFNGFWTYFKRIRKGEKEILLASNTL